MPGFGSNRADVPVTPNRKTHFRFDVSSIQLTEPVWGIDRQARDIGRGASTSATNVHLVGDVAWELKPYNTISSYTHERTEAQGSIFKVGAPGIFGITLAPGFQEVNRFRRDTDLPDATTGINPNVVTTGDLVFEKTVTSSGSFIAANSADQAAYPSPDSASDNYVMDRVLTGTAPMPANTPIVFRFETFGTKASVPFELYTVYFSGPAGTTENFIGKGEYCLKLRGLGYAVLYERKRTRASSDIDSNYSWRVTDSFEWCRPDNIAGAAHKIVIHPIVSTGRPPYRNGAIVFEFSQTDRAYAAQVPVSLLAYQAQFSATRRYTYVVPRWKTADNPSTQAVPVRVDQRRNLRSMVQVSGYKYPTTGSIQDDPFSLPFYPSTRRDFVLQWQAKLPAGCTITGKLFNATTGLELTLVSSTSSSKTYSCPDKVRGYYAKFDFTGTGDATGSLYSYKVTRNGVLEEVGPGEFEPSFPAQAMSSLSITGPEADPSHESVSFVLNDLADNMPRIKNRAYFPIVVETEYDTDPSKRCVLIKAHTARISGQQKGSAGRGLGAGQASLYPAPKWKRYTVSAFGEWQRLSEQLSQVRWSWWQDPAAPEGVPYKVTDIIRTVLNWCGYLPEDVDVPDLGIRLFTTNQEDQHVEPLTNLGEYVVRIARDYLGYFLIFDGNAGTRGKWRLRPPTVGPYTPLAKFQTAGAGVGKFQHYLPSYPQSPPTGFIVKGSLETWKKKPEANVVIVSGVGYGYESSKVAEAIQGGSNSAKGGLALLTQIAVNRVSFNFGSTVTADPNHPDYLGYFKPLVVLDPLLQKQEAVNWFCQRYYDISAHGIVMARFEAPLLLINDPNDAELAGGKVRPLRYYDAIQINGADWLIRNVNPYYSKDDYQMATYECEAPRINGTPFAPSPPTEP